MHGPSHLMISWFMAEGVGLEKARDRRLVALSGIAPDIDAVAYAAGIVWYGFDKDLAYQNVWEVIHHRYTHGLGFVLLIGMLVFLLTRWPAMTRSDVLPATTDHALKVAGFAMLASTVHVFADLVAGGPTWPVFPLWPITDHAWAVSWSYTLAQWPNTLILVGCLVAMMVYPRFVGYSPLESINYDLDRWFVHIIQHGSSRAADPSEISADSDRRHRIIRILIYLVLLLVTAAILLPLGFDWSQLNLPGTLK